MTVINKRLLDQYDYNCGFLSVYKFLEIFFQRFTEKSILFRFNDLCENLACQ